MKHSLNVFLFRDTYRDLGSAMEATDLEGFEGVQPLPGALEFEARCFIRSAYPSSPRWLPFFQSGFDIPVGRLWSQSASLLVFVLAEGRAFLVCAGQGYHRAPRTALEPDFGLRATLNAVGSEQLRSLQSRTIDPLTVQKLVVANRDTNLQALAMDQYRELLARIEGKPIDSTIGMSIAGADAVSLQCDIEIHSLADKCSDLLRLSRQNTYQTHFKFIDQIRPERDPSVVQHLDENLRGSLRTQGGAMISLALPTIERYGDVAGYVVKAGRKVLGDLGDLRTDRLMACVALIAADKDPLQDLRIVAVNATGDLVEQGPLADWIVAEIRINDSIYVRTLGSWYRINHDYVQAVNNELRSIDVIQQAGYLPPMLAISGRLEAEGEYNRRCATASRKCLDQQNITLERYGAVEPCDLFTDRRHLIHVKKQTESSTLSHLWGQGLVSAQLLQESRPFREALRRKLGSMNRLVALDHVRPSDFTVVYAIATEVAEFPSRLPFFSKVNLLYHHRQLKRLGFGVKLYRIRYA